MPNETPGLTDLLCAALRRIGCALSMVLAACAASAASAQTAPVVFVHQGADWTWDVRDAFYSQDQGSRIMPLAWMQALTQADGEPFLADELARYGYLSRDAGSESDLPIGFTAANTADGAVIGMTCSACHTREIEVGGATYRIDGGPAFADFQSFLADLNAAVTATLQSPARFDAFADAVLGQEAAEEDKDQLKVALEAWGRRFDALVSRSLPDKPWGPARLDAISMILNRLTGLDIGDAPDRLIVENIARADAPARYPFLWNASKQDKTQWLGFADNGSPLLALSRNLGQVYGVFAEFHPVADGGFFMNRDYLSHNSANFRGLEALEEMVEKIGPPAWPWPIDHRLAAEGHDIFSRRTEAGGCVECHGVRDGETRPLFHKTWATPVMDVGTDTRECSILARDVRTGVMEGARIRGFVSPLGATDSAFDVLEASVLGAILQYKNPLASSAMMAEGRAAGTPPEFETLKGAFRRPDEAAPGAMMRAPEGSPQPGCAYESRVMEGVWAAAPYLHNGSVPSLAELLKPAAERIASFEVGPAYDIDSIGLASDQPDPAFTLHTTDCSQVDSGDSRCGHEYGTALSPEEKAALLEYLKTL